MRTDILVVDDDLIFHQLYKAHFAPEVKEGRYRIFDAHYGEEALGLLSKEPGIELVISDLQMPGMDGLELMAQIRKTRPDLPVIVASAFGELTNIRQAMNQGAFDFINKPVDFADLKQTVEKAIKSVAQRRALKAAKQKAETELSRLERTLEQVSGGLFLLDPATFKFVYANLRGLEILGLPLNELLNQDLSFLLGPAGLSAQLNALAQLQAGSIPKVEVECRYATQGNEPQPYEAVIQYAQMGLDEKRLVLNLWNISKRKLLQQKHQMLAKAIEQVKDHIMITDQDNHIQFVNPTFEKDTGYSLEEIEGKNPSILKSDRHQPQFYQRLWEQILSGRSWEGELINKKKDGSFYWAESTISPVFGEDGKIVNFVQVARDRTKERALKAQLLQSQKMESIGTLAGGIAHEINNPIGFVYSNLGSLQEYLVDFMDLLKLYHGLEVFVDTSDKKIKQVIDEIEAKKKEVDLEFLLSDLPGLVSDTLEGAERVRGIVQNLKDFSHVDSAILEPTDLNEGLKKTLKLLAAELKYKVELKTEFGLLKMVDGFPQQLNQVFLNLILNAAQSIETKGTISITTEMDKDFAVIKIKDTGCGISEENLSRLFEPFFTTKDVGKGTGLGLAVSYNIIKKHQGKILVDSKLGVGTQFTLRLPLHPKLINEA